MSRRPTSGVHTAAEAQHVTVVEDPYSQDGPASPKGEYSNSTSKRWSLTVAEKSRIPDPNGRSWTVKPAAGLRVDRDPWPFRRVRPQDNPRIVELDQTNDAIATSVPVSAAATTPFDNSWAIA